MSLDVVYWLRGDTHTEMAKLSAESVNRIYPQANVYMLRDLAPEEPAMLANLRTQLDYLMLEPTGRRVLFLDADILLLRELPWLESLSPHCVITWRDKISAASEDPGIAEIMPYNFGVIAANVCPETREAWLWMYARVCQMAQRYKKWYGNQLALAELCGARPDSGYMASIVPILWAPTQRAHQNLSVLKVPCEEFNYTPASADEDVSSRYVLHFKGNRKEMMSQFAGKLLS